MQVSPSSRVIQSPPENSAARPYFRLTFTLPLLYLYPAVSSQKFIRNLLRNTHAKTLVLSYSLLGFTIVYYSLLFRLLLIWLARAR